MVFVAFKYKILISVPSGLKPNLPWQQVQRDNFTHSQSWFKFVLDFQYKRHSFLLYFFFFFGLSTRKSWSEALSAKWPCLTKCNLSSGRHQIQVLPWDMRTKLLQVCQNERELSQDLMRITKLKSSEFLEPEAGMIPVALGSTANLLSLLWTASKLGYESFSVFYPKVLPGFEIISHSLLTTLSFSSFNSTG